MAGIILPTSPTPNDVRFRCLQIASALAIAQPTILKTVLFDTQAQLTAAGSPASGQVVAECTLALEDMPALVGVTIGGTQREMNSVANRRVTRDYIWLVLFYQMCDESVAEQEAALGVAWSKLDELPDYLASRSVGQLKFNDSGLRGLAPDGVGHMADQGVDAISWLDGIYSSATYTLPITTLRG